MGNACIGFKLPKADVTYLLDNTCFTEPQIREWYRGFMQDCPDGKLRRAQFLSIYESLFSDHRASAFYGHVFRTFDEDDSGTVDFKEFLLAISTTQSGMPKDRLRLAFKLYDVDRNGYVEIHEMVEVVKAVYLMVDPSMDELVEKAEETAHAVFSKVDADDNGLMTEDEFVEACMNDQGLYNMLASGEINGKKKHSAF